MRAPTHCNTSTVKLFESTECVCASTATAFSSFLLFFMNCSQKDIFHTNLNWHSAPSPLSAPSGIKRESVHEFASTRYAIVPNIRFVFSLNIPQESHR